MIFGIIYIAVALILGGILTFNVGLEDAEVSSYRRHGEVEQAIFVIIIWPIIAAGLILAAPFIGIYYLAKLLGRKNALGDASE